MLTPYYQDEFITLYNGDAREILPLLPSECVQSCVTSPPYFGLRDYGTAKWFGGDDGCDHKGDPMRTRANINKNTNSGGDDVKNREIHNVYRSECGKCGAVRQDSQIGLESSPKEFISQLELIFTEVKRVMRKDGTLWLNLGDSYAAGKGQSGSQGAEHQEKRNKNQRSLNKGYQTLGGQKQTRALDDRAMLRAENLKPKDLIGIPWRAAFALQDAGFWLRQDIIWSKPNPMPESVADRCTKSHEYIFLLSRSEQYFFDAQAIKEPAKDWGARDRTNYRSGTDNKFLKQFGLKNGNFAELGRNKRSVWNISTKPYADAHFATFPPEIPEICIKAGTSAEGECSKCGAPYERVVEKQSDWQERKENGATAGNVGANASYQNGVHGTNNTQHYLGSGIVIDKGFSSSCICASAEAVPQTVLDPFGGAGTTAIVAKRLGRKCILIELNPEYCALIVKRIKQHSMPLFEKTNLEK